MELPESVECIEYHAFRECTSITSMVIPKRCIQIGEEAFCDCSNLKELMIPRSVTVIGKDAFSGCGNLTVRALEGSYAERYAKENNIPFHPLEE